MSGNFIFESVVTLKTVKGLCGILLGRMALNFVERSIF